jgi:hypothetical protein
MLFCDLYYAQLSIHLTRLRGVIDAANVGNFRAKFSLNIAISGVILGRFVVIHLVMLCFLSMRLTVSLLKSTTNPFITSFHSI